ncbi:hypothetical protein ABT294_18035 [Nonomuraea sp. NPDC000554]|uniref:hypothetical protein n=1 Tax=Nonomuraea sp. NPDC000554 TaxID=3154259 RepID=UPI0033262927
MNFTMDSSSPVRGWRAVRSKQLAELRPLGRVEAAGGAGLLLESDRVLDPGFARRR